MSNELKALLCNALVCPGSGHLLLGKKWLGWLILLLTAISLSVLLTDIYQVANDIANEIMSGILPMDLPNILAEIHNRSVAIGSGALYLFLGVWLLGILDSLRWFIQRRATNQ
ncbi:hypothetical protein SHAM105786_09060 [Shewanella amazonensis]|uniref:Uncharacterized protein n=1 Tax=Shewanella amazonensis (strain ATCC BAA-1098 / SB2B) TaxID=326297 RepID=A1S2V4_SHEAM|nr:hypothetical protein [Shewanella amazonensis]ABL98710.1 conserved hypothetical protein [Shewanella amazonensis SB2B]